MGPDSSRPLTKTNEENIMGPRGKKTQEKFLSVSEEEGLKDQKKELEGELNQTEEYGTNPVNKSAIQGQIKRLDSAIHERTPGRISGSNKDKLAAEEKQLEETLSQGIPSRYEMKKPQENPGAVRKHMSWGERNVDNINRYREIQRQLRPGEPRSVENLRKDR